MAGTRKTGAPGASMSRGELIGGFLYLPLYVIGLAWLLELTMAALGKKTDSVTLNILYFLINFLAVALIFRRFLIASLSGVAHQFWAFVQAVILGFAFYYVLSWVTVAALQFFNLAVANPNDDYVSTLAGDNFRLVAVCTILLAPMVEETLFRGLIFGNLRIKSRVAAYLVSALAFAAIHVWQFAGEVGWESTLLSAVQYLPAGVALGWTYEKADTIWAPVLVHCFINAVTMGVIHG